MPQHRFRMELTCRYQRPDNTPVELAVRNRADGEWQEFVLGFQTPGFQSFVYAILNCQHLYMRTNAAERGLLLESSKGIVDVAADERWLLQKVHVHFEARLASGEPAPGDVDYIVERMGRCPVSVNLRKPQDTVTTLTLS